MTSHLTHAAKMCPFGFYEIVSCKEQSSVAVSICKNPEELIMSYQDSPISRVVFFSAYLTEKPQHYIFTRQDDGSDQLELIIRKSVDDHTRGLLKTVTAGVQNEFSFRCVSRNISQ